MKRERTMRRAGPRAHLAAAAVAACSLLAAGAAGAASPPAEHPAPPFAEPEQPETTGRAIVLVEPPGGGGSGTTVAETPAELKSLRERISGVVDREDLDPERSLPELAAVAVDLPPGESVSSLRRDLARDPAVAAVEPEYRRSLRLVPDDPAFTAADPNAPRDDTFQWHLRRERFKWAWGRSSGSGAKVAVIDSGIDASHPDLSGRVKVARDQRLCPSPCLLPPPGNARTDENGHGTHISGLACATGNNGYAVASAAFRCRLIVEKSDLTDSSIAASIRDAADRNADVINMSFGGPGGSSLVRNAIDYAWGRDAVMVAAASNEDETDQGVPARYLQRPGTGPEIRRGRGLVVTAAEYDGSRAWFDPGLGTGLSLAAYGASSSGTAGIFSTFPADSTEIERGDPLQRIPPCPTCRASFRGDNRFAYLQGTSMATPQVAGAAALIRSRRPGIGAERVITLLKRKASGDEFSDELGWGILNAKRALEAALG